MHWSLRLFLLSSAIACGAEPAAEDSSADATDSSTGDEGSSTTGDPSQSSTDPDDASSSEASSAPTSTGDTTTTTTTMTETSSADTSSTTTETSASSDSTGEMPNEACVAGCAVEFGCHDECSCGPRWESEDACVQWCDANLDEAAAFSEFCRDAWEGMSACIGTLDCSEFAEFHNPQQPDYPCVSEAEALMFECEGQ